MATLNVDNGDSAAICYELVKNTFCTQREGTDVYHARVEAPTKSLREVAEVMVREGLEFSSAQVVSMLESFASVVSRLLQEGNAVNVGSLVHFRPSIRGKFYDPEATFNKTDHQIVITATIGSALRNAAANASVTRATAVRLPEIELVYNGTTGEQDTCVSQGVLLAMGSRFIWNTNASDEGFFAAAGENVLPCSIIKVDDAKETVSMTLPFALEVDEAVELSFRTRNTTNGTLAIVTYGKKIVTVAGA